MKNILFAAIATVLVSSAASAKELTYHLRELPDTYATDMLSSGPLGQDCNQSTAPGTFQSPDPGPLDPIERIVDQIINIGKKVWAVVESGRPVVNLKMDVGTALPVGVKCWLDLDSWQRPQSKLYEATFVNAYNVEVVKFTYRLIWISGGASNGVGRYVGYTAVQPVDLQVSWGYRFDAEAAVPTAINIGTKAQPVGGLQINVTYKVNTVMKSITESQAYFVDGNGRMDILN